MNEYFIVTNSFAAPFVSDSAEQYITADSPRDALTLVAETYTHPCGLFSAAVYATHKDYLRGEKSLAQWWSNAAIAQRGGQLSPADDPKHGRIWESV